MNRTYEDMSKEELVTLVTRLAKQHDEWRELARGYATILKSTNLPPELIE